jgi:hypothetical protein
MTNDETLYHFADGGEMKETGKTCIIGPVELPLLQCAICGEELDPSDYDCMGTRAETDAKLAAQLIYERLHRPREKPDG